MSIGTFGVEKCRLECLGSENVDWEVWVRKMSWVPNMFGFLKVWVRKCRFEGLGPKMSIGRFGFEKCRLGGLGSKNVDLKVLVRKMIIGRFGSEKWVLRSFGPLFF